MLQGTVGCHEFWVCHPLAFFPVNLKKNLEMCGKAGFNGTMNVEGGVCQWEPLRHFLTGQFP